ncbi:hypothetical protein DVA67_010615 [Solirubrobacter sp. CPCC 204708]|uniref:Uncharacterized protein n=1 Tax=Solirubrobacter deserti TaxID=2282478 RepID=A0ABT4RSR2_9ACTN|nr:hypothetical protein [Solirubrobacter deserti]MBE2316430.1 hypothetical protein [Solirubrobacter deserti]MDA0141633.1 hypothetical protein [Solirubrobacter deserti]
MKVVAAAIASLVFLAVVGYLVLRGDEQTHVQVRSGDAIADDPNREDDYGAETIRAYLTAALRCDDAALARFGSPIEELAGLCEADGVEAEVARDQLDPRGRALWKLSDPPDLYLWVAQEGGQGWRVTAVSGPPRG